ncbi:MAG: TOBE domain-containing protein, partial [Burkholderiales bacterium]
AMNLVPCLLRTNGAGLAVEIEGGAVLPVPSAREAAYRAHAGRRLIFGLRPEHLAERPPGAPAEAALSIEVEVVEPQGIETMAVGHAGATELCARLPGSTSARRGARLSLSVDMTQMHLIDPETDQVIR